MNQPARRCLLAVFAHPDDETSTAAGTFTKYAREGVDIHVVTATGANAVTSAPATSKSSGVICRPYARRNCAARLYGANRPLLLDYRDQELITADFETLTQDVLRAMASVRPDVVITLALPVSLITTITKPFTARLPRRFTAIATLRSSHQGCIMSPFHKRWPRSSPFTYIPRR